MQLLMLENLTVVCIKKESCLITVIPVPRNTYISRISERKVVLRQEIIRTYFKTEKIK